jgi:photosystem II stability/assembly factor-like uncharacterized protein
MRAGWQGGRTGVLLVEGLGGRTQQDLQAEEQQSLADVHFAEAQEGS